MLPGGKLEFGESASDAARRETIEEAGCVPDELSPVGLYEMRGSAHDRPYHVGRYDEAAIDDQLVRDGITMTSFPIAERSLSG